MITNGNDPWEGRATRAASEFALNCEKLRSENPYSEAALVVIVNTLMTELWDRGFSQLEIRTAFEGAVIDMPRYAAGVERRGED